MRRPIFRGWGWWAHAFYKIVKCIQLFDTRYHHYPYTILYC